MRSHARQSFHFQKITGTFKLIFLFYLHKPFLYIEEQLQKIKLEIKFFYYFFLLFPKISKTVFDLYKGKNNFVLGATFKNVI